MNKDFIWELSNRELSSFGCPFGNCPFGNCPVWELSLWELSGLGIVRLGIVRLGIVLWELSIGNCPLPPLSHSAFLAYPCPGML